MPLWLLIKACCFLYSMELERLNMLFIKINANSEQISRSLYESGEYLIIHVLSTTLIREWRLFVRGAKSISYSNELYFLFFSQPISSNKTSKIFICVIVSNNHFLFPPYIYGPSSKTINYTEKRAKYFRNWACTSLSKRNTAM